MNFNIQKFDKILSRGLCSGVGDPNGQMCIEAAICATLGLPHGDDPQCITKEIRSYKIRLNDSPWSTPQARAAGLRDLGIAQLGSKGVVDGKEFTRRLAEKTVRVLLPTLFRDLFPDDPILMAAALRCEQEGTDDAAHAAHAAAYTAAHAARAADAAHSAHVAARAACAAYTAAAYTAATYAARAAAHAAYTAAHAAHAATCAAYTAAGDKYLILSAKLALEVLRELNSPGVSLLEAA